MKDSEECAKGIGCGQGGQTRRENLEHLYLLDQVVLEPVRLSC